MHIYTPSYYTHTIKYVADIQDSSGPVAFSYSSIIGTGGKYRVWLDLSLAALILATYHHSPYPISDGEIAGELPKCGGSTFIPYCTEAVAFTAWNDPDLTSRWRLTNAQNPPVSAQQQGTFARITRYMTARGIFSSVNSYVYFRVMVTCINHKACLGSECFLLVTYITLEEPTLTPPFA